MKTKWIAGFVLAAMAFSACDDSTDNIGASLTNRLDRFQIVADTFTVSSRSIMVDSVVTQSRYTYLGRIKDPETGAYVTGSYTTQFMHLEETTASMLPAKSEIVSLEDDNVIADSCHLNIYINSYVGDSLAPMKLKVYELSTPVKEGVAYYSDFAPEEEGIVRTDGIIKEKSYSYTNFLVKDSARASSSYMPYINITLNEPYTDKEGNTFKNYGTYILRSYYDHPERFKNSYSFVHDVCPGFYFKTTGGLGLMSEIYTTELVIYLRATVNGTVTSYAKIFTGTEEVMQTNNIINDKERMKQLAADNTCTYIKTPAGIFTEVTLPVDEMKRGHETDTISSAQISFYRYNALDTDEMKLKDASYLLMIPRDSINSFFESKSLPNYTTSYIAALSTSKNSYSFNNITHLISHMYAHRNETENWNKVVLIPVEATLSSSTSSTDFRRVSNLMSITSSRLVGGSANPHAPITISVIYNQFR
ncbi:MAG: DUF4270 domain-containing protein [Prevotella sp.]|nr:DUF4270 domain-containing protein [Prevotella sp.]